MVLPGQNQKTTLLSLSLVLAPPVSIYKATVASIVGPHVIGSGHACSGAYTSKTCELVQLRRHWLIDQNIRVIFEGGKWGSRRGWRRSEQKHCSCNYKVSHWVLSVFCHSEPDCSDCKTEKCRTCSQLFCLNSVGSKQSIDRSNKEVSAFSDLGCSVSRYKRYDE